MPKVRSDHRYLRTDHCEYSGVGASTDSAPSDRGARWVASAPRAELFTTFKGLLALTRCSGGLTV